MPVLSQIYLYPIKSCAGIEMPEVDLDRFGPVGDRRWMLVNSMGKFITQRDRPELACLAAVPTPGGLALEYRGARFAVERPKSSKRKLVTVWMDSVPAVDAGNEVALWLHEALGFEARLVYMPDDSQRLVDGAYASAGETVSFADGFPLLLISQAALDLLNSKLGQGVPMNRFRPNLVVDGCEPHAEDEWQKIRIGEMEFVVAKPCARCAVPSIDQATGEKDSEILRVLADYRRFEDPEGGPRQVFFGQNLLYTSAGRRGTTKLAVGDEVTILR
jgi:uncharacterized protein YcbX